jgi:GGDEF domain-containing protein
MTRGQECHRKPHAGLSQRWYILGHPQCGSGCLRATDKFGRIGGEEFAILLTESDRDHAIGIGTQSDRTAEIERLVRLAEKVLYEAKASGGDQWRVA